MDSSAYYTLDDDIPLEAFILRNNSSKHAINTSSFREDVDFSFWDQNKAFIPLDSWSSLAFCFFAYLPNDAIH